MSGVHIPYSIYLYAPLRVIVRTAEQHILHQEMNVTQRAISEPFVHHTLNDLEL